MKIIDNYIRKQFVTMTMIALFALLGIDGFFSLINELRYLGKGNYELPQAIGYLMLTFPRRVYIFFPWAALLGTLFSLGMLAKNSELTVMEVSGISRIRIAWSVIKASLVLVTMMIILGEGVAPAAERYAQKLKTRAFSKGNVLYTSHGLWIRNNMEFVHIGNYESKRILNNITRFGFDNNLKLKEVTFAQKALKQKGGWLLLQVTGTKLDSENTTKIMHSELFVPNLLDVDILQTVSEKHLERLSILQIWRLIKARTQNELAAQNYEMALWMKIFYPFAILTMIYLGIPFIFGPLRSTSIGLKLLVGLGINFSFYLINSIFSQLPLVIGLSPIVSAIIPILGFLLIATVMMGFNIKKKQKVAL